MNILSTPSIIRKTNPNVEMLRPFDNIRFKSQKNSFVSSEANVSNIYEDEQQKTSLPTIKSKKKQSEQQIALNLSNHLFFEINNSAHSISSMIISFEKYAHLMRNLITFRKGYKFIVKIVFYDRSLFNKHVDLNKKYKELMKSHNDMNKKYKKNLIARKKIKKAYEELQLKLQTIQEKLAQTKLKLKEINETLQQERTKLKNDAAFINSAKKSTRREKNISPFINIQPNKEKTILNGKVRNTDSSKKLFEKNSDDYESLVYTVKKKFDTDESIYSIDKKQTTYVLPQIKNPIFDAIHAGVKDQKNLFVKLFFKKIKKY